jgi:hypothetical protein
MATKFQSITIFDLVNYTSSISTNENISLIKLFKALIKLSTSYKINIFPNQEDFISKHVRDYEYIPEFTTKKCRELNKFAVESLVNVLKLNYNKKFLIVTHHLPSFDLIETSKRFDSFYQNFNSA